MPFFGKKKDKPKEDGQAAKPVEAKKEKKEKEKKDKKDKKEKKEKRRERSAEHQYVQHDGRHHGRSGRGDAALIESTVDELLRDASNQAFDNFADRLSVTEALLSESVEKGRISDGAIISIMDKMNTIKDLYADSLGMDQIQLANYLQSEMETPKANPVDGGHEAAFGDEEDVITPSMIRSTFLNAIEDGLAQYNESRIIQAEDLIPGAETWLAGVGVLYVLTHDSGKGSSLKLERGRIVRRSNCPADLIKGFDSCLTLRKMIREFSTREVAAIVCVMMGRAPPAGFVADDKRRNIINEAEGEVSKVVRRLSLADPALLDEIKGTFEAIEESELRRHQFGGSGSYSDDGGLNTRRPPPRYTETASPPVQGKGKAPAASPAPPAPAPAPAPAKKKSNGPGPAAARPYSYSYSDEGAALPRPVTMGPAPAPAPASTRPLPSAPSPAPAPATVPARTPAPAASPTKSSGGAPKLAPPPAAARSRAAPQTPPAAAAPAGAGKEEGSYSESWSDAK